MANILRIRGDNYADTGGKAERLRWGHRANAEEGTSNTRADLT